MHCHEDALFYLSWGLILLGLHNLTHHKQVQSSYGRHLADSPPAWMVPAKVAWFLQETPALLAPLLSMLAPHAASAAGKQLLLVTCCSHYFQRTFVYSLLTRGKPFPLRVMAMALVICALNGFLQGHPLLHCAQLRDDWSADYRYKTGMLLFFAGVAINVHSDHLLRNLRKPGQEVYRIPTGGAFEYVSGANFLGEILEWVGYAVATWSFPELSFAVFSLCFIGPRAYDHHGFYQEKFINYPKSRKALIPFIF